MSSARGGTAGGTRRLSVEVGGWLGPVAPARALCQACGARCADDKIQTIELVGSAVQSRGLPAAVSDHKSCSIQIKPCAGRRLIRHLPFKIPIDCGRPSDYAKQTMPGTAMLR